ncbi:MAG: hypothetical protein ABJF23_29565 [Bryobacteraceae bacterium]
MEIARVEVIRSEAGLRNKDKHGDRCRTRRPASVKIESVFCDIHPACQLKATPIDSDAASWVLQQRRLSCTSPNCERQFHYDFGYFQFHVGQEPDFGDLKVKPKCRKDHDTIYMLLTRIDGELTYACFAPDCTSAAAYAG